MKKYISRCMVIIATVAILLLRPNNQGQVLAETPTVSITSPAEQATVSSLAVIVGTVDFADFLKYEIFLQGGGNMIWAAVGYSPVTNGNLARLDPRTFADGTYRMIVRQVRKDSNYTDFTGPTFKIDNPLNAPLPYYPEVEPNFLYPAAGKAIARFRNCTGSNIELDYGSPTPFLSSGQIKLAGKKEGVICAFADIMLLPGEYRGTAREGNNATGYGFMAEAGKVYQLLYNGTAVGKFNITVETIKGDDKTGKASSLVQTAVVTPTLSVSNASVVAPAAPVAEKKVLPESGQEIISQTPFVLEGMAFILFMVVTGVIAIYRGRYAM